VKLRKSKAVQNGSWFTRAVDTDMGELQNTCEWKAEKRKSEVQGQPRQSKPETSLMNKLKVKLKW
jgi:hypothetical protein